MRCKCKDCGYETDLSALLDVTRNTQHKGIPLCEACLEKRDERSFRAAGFEAPTCTLRNTVDCPKTVTSPGGEILCMGDCPDE